MDTETFPCRPLPTEIIKVLSNYVAWNEKIMQWKISFCLWTLKIKTPENEKYQKNLNMEKVLRHILKPRYSWINTLLSQCQQKNKYSSTKIDLLLGHRRELHYILQLLMILCPPTHIVPTCFSKLTLRASTSFWSSILCWILASLLGTASNWNVRM